MTLVLVIDDNPLDRKVLRDALVHSGFSVEEASDGAAGLRLVYDCRPDVILLDVMMPGMDGWTSCARIREVCDTPLIMLTSLNREEEITRGLELGADDFLSKPVGSQHLLARVRAVLRRRHGPERQSEFLYDDGLLRIDAAHHEVKLATETISLTPTEFRLLLALASAPNRLQPYADLLRAVWGPEYRDDIDFLRVYVWRLRKKLEASADSPRWLATERGFGYRFISHTREHA